MLKLGVSQIYTHFEDNYSVGWVITISHSYLIIIYGQFPHDAHTPSVPVNSQELDLPIWPQAIVNR